MYRNGHKMTNYLRNKDAMTLVETLFCIAIFSMVSVACFSMVRIGWDAWLTSSAQVEISQRIAQGSSKIFSDLAQSSPSVIVDVPADDHWYSSITFTKADDVSADNVVWGTAINYALGGTDAHQLIRTQDSQEQVIANLVQSIQFRRLIAHPNIVEAQVQISVPTFRGAQRVTTTQVFKVYLRNL